MGNPATTTAFITASAITAGAAITSGVTLLAQWRTRVTEERRWRRDAAERTVARFHESRLAAYADFLESADTGFGIGLVRSNARLREIMGDKMPPMIGPRLPSAVDPAAERAVVQRLWRARWQVHLVAGSAAVRSAAAEAADAVRALNGFAEGGFGPGAPDRHTALVNRCGAARDRFAEAAAAEISGERPAVVTPRWFTRALRRMRVRRGATDSAAP